MQVLIHCFYSVQVLTKRVDLLYASNSVPNAHDLIINAFMESLNDVIDLMVHKKKLLQITVIMLFFSVLR